jgi:hypothetical protein
MSASDVRATQRRFATALVAGWLVLVAALAAMFFVIPHKGGFAPELGSSGTFVVFAVLYSISYIGGFVALWMYIRLSRSGDRRPQTRLQHCCRRVHIRSSRGHIGQSYRGPVIGNGL